MEFPVPSIDLDPWPRSNLKTLTGLVNRIVDIVAAPKEKND